MNHRDNPRPGCTCPPWRYNPAFQHMRPTNPECEKHGDNGKWDE